MNTSETLERVLHNPEAVLQELGTAGALDVLSKLAEDPEVAAVLKDCELVKMIESGKKYVTGTIIKEG